MIGPASDEIVLGPRETSKQNSPPLADCRRRAVSFRVETFEPADGFTPSKAFAARVLWRDYDGNDQSKLLVAAPEKVLAVVVRGESDARPAASEATATLPDENTMRRPPRRRQANAAAELTPQQ